MEPAEQCSNPESAPMERELPGQQQLCAPDADPAQVQLPTQPVMAYAATTPCRHCGRTDNPEGLFQPCNCPPIHRTCFRDWRQGWINPHNYFCCPDCMFRYRIERVRESTTESKQEIRRRYRIQVLKLWLGTLLFFFGFIGILATICYYADRSDKNIPVGLKYMMTSVVQGLPEKNSTDVWREDFKKPETAVWPYYIIFATFLVCLCILIAFAAMGCTFDEDERRKGKACCEDCSDSGSSTGSCYWYCYDPCPECKCNDCCCTGGCSDCSLNDIKCDGGGEAMLIIVLLIIIAVIVGGVFVLIFWAIKKWTLLYDRMTDMMLQQQAELEGETVVLAMNETWRPTDAV